jgi:protein-disulfide isomerase/uncharacterized membrane protein/rhodanese-related sulfurtransferase
VRRSLIFALTLVGLFDSLYLLWVYASPSHAMVCLGSGCDEVRASRFAHFLGLPTPLYGVLIYGVLALLVFAEPLVSAGLAAWVRRGIVAISAAGVAASAGLTAIEAWVIHAWCAWCVVQAIAIVLIFVLSITLLPAPLRNRSEARSAVLRYVTLLSIAVAAGAPAFSWLKRHAEAPVQAAAAAPLSASDIAERLVRPDSHVAGNPQSPVTLVEFGDLQCPSCAAAAPEIRQLRASYGDRVRFVFRQFPLEKVHMYALKSAQASECAAQQGKFWEAVDRIYSANGDLKDESLERYAGELGLDTAKFHACFTSGATLPTVRRDFEDGFALGVRGTPTFFLGRQRIVGTPERAKFEQLLNSELALAGGGSTPVSGSTTSPKPGDQAGGNKPGSKTPANSASTAVPGFGSGNNSFLNLQASSVECSEDAPKGPEPAMIHTAEAEKLFHDGSVFVDVRSTDDFQKARIAGARSLPLLEAERRSTELPRDKTIVLYEGGSGGPTDVCAASRAVGRVLLARGFKKVVVYQDGLSGWQKQSLPVDR